MIAFFVNINFNIRLYWKSAIYFYKINKLDKFKNKFPIKSSLLNSKFNFNKKGNNL